MLPQRRPVRCPDLHIEDERNGLHTYESPPRNRNSESRIYDSDLHERLRAQPRHTDTAMYSEADEISMSESVEMSDSDDNYVDAPLTRDIGGHVDAPPSYHEATLSAPPNETSFNNSPSSASPPSYDEFLTNQSRYATSS